MRLERSDSALGQGRWQLNFSNVETFTPLLGWRLLPTVLPAPTQKCHVTKTSELFLSHTSPRFTNSITNLAD